MVEQKYKVLGVMSGTSLDGVDCAVVQFIRRNNRWQYTFLQGETLFYPQKWVEKLRTAISLETTQLHLLNIDYTYLLGEMLEEFIRQNKLSDIDFIARSEERRVGKECRSRWSA